MLIHRDGLNQTGWQPSWLLCTHHCAFLCQQGAKSLVQPGRLWGGGHSATLRFQSPRVQHPSWTLHSVAQQCLLCPRWWKDWKWMIHMAQADQGQKNLFSYSCPNLFMTRQDFSAILSNVSDAVCVTAQRESATFFFSVNAQRKCSSWL